MKRSASTSIWLCLIFLFFSLPVTAQAQPEQTENEVLQALKEVFQQDYMSFGILLQSQGEFHWDPEISNGQGENTFRIPTARLKVSGRLDENFNYLLQMDATRSPALLDIGIGYKVSDRLSFTTGLMKPGISAGYLLPAASTDFINRPRVVGTLVANRDIGLLGEATLTEGLTFATGIFNGRSQNINSNDNEFYYTGRLQIASDIDEETTLQVGGNIGHGQENGTVIGNGSLPAVDGERFIYGFDLRLEHRAFLFSAELLSSRLEYSPALDDEVLGYHLTGGFQATDNLQLLLRLDHVSSNELPQTVFPVPEKLLLGGINYTFTEAASFAFNYRLNPDDFDFSNHAMLARMQIAF